MSGLLALTSYPHSKKVDPEKPPGQINHPPQISSEAVLIAQRGSAYSYQVFASDPDQDRLCYWLIGPKGMTINAEGLVSWIPQKAGIYLIFVNVTDGCGGRDTQAFTLLVAE